MVVAYGRTVLAVGIGSKADALRELAVRVKVNNYGYEAAGSFKYENIDTLVSKWHLADMTEGKFIKGVKKIRPSIPVVAIIDNNDEAQEKDARSVGVTAVLTDDCDNEYLVSVVAQITGADRITQLPAVTANRN